MERLNDILGRTPPHRQHYTDDHLDQTGRGQDISSSRYPSRELTSQPGSSSRSSQPQYQHKIPPRTRYEQGKYVQRGTRPAYSRQQTPAQGNQYQRDVQRLGDLDSHTPYEEGFIAGREQKRSKGGNTSPDLVDKYSALAGSDVREEWEDDTGDMLYGDWADEENDVHERFNARGPGMVAHERNSIYHTPARESEMYYGHDSSFITRDLRMASNGDSGPQPPRNPGDYYVHSVQHVSERSPSQDVQRSVRMTQPLKPQTIVRSHHEDAHESNHAQMPSPQLARNEQIQQQSLSQPCPICKGAGYLRSDVPFGHPTFGKPVACECKEAERKAKRRRQLQEMSDLGAFYDKSFRNFNVHVPGIQEAYNCAYEFAQDPNGWLLMIGPNGCGKTHLAAAIANKSLEDGALVLFATVPDLLDHLRAAFAPTSNEVYDQLFSRMREAEVLVLDDLGAQQSSPWANEKLFQLLNYRYNSRFPTVITANSRGLQGIDERIRSRLTDASLVTTVIMDRAKDFRPNNPRRVM